MENPPVNFTDLVIELVNSSGKVSRAIVFAHLIDKGANSETCWAAYSSAVASNQADEVNDGTGCYLVAKQ